MQYMVKYQDSLGYTINKVMIDELSYIAIKNSAPSYGYRYARIFYKNEEFRLRRNIDVEALAKEEMDEIAACIL